MDWTLEEVELLYKTPFIELIPAAQNLHRQNFNPKQIQISTLLSLKTGGCSEDCSYCPQSIHHSTDIKSQPLMRIEQVVKNAEAAKEKGATRFCMGAAWRSPNTKQLDQIIDIVSAVKNLGMETCATLGMLKPEQAEKLKTAGLDYYNHNLDTSANYYKHIITTRTYQNRLDTLQAVQESGLKVCCGGIIGMGENEIDRIGLLQTLATLPEHPASVPINQLVKVEGTKIDDKAPFDPIDFVRIIALARILMPCSYVRLSAGREAMNESTQALCFLAGANSIFYGEKLLTTANPEAEADRRLMKKLGIEAEPLKDSAKIV
ncbi:MAG: biotin synthase BioB [Pseudomonadota bacterium]|nr:biotin synthase BioB [Pseudomonadota bacterium]